MGQSRRYFIFKWKGLQTTDEFEGFFLEKNRYTGGRQFKSDMLHY